MKQVRILSVIIGCINLLIFSGILGNNGIAYFGIAYISVSLIQNLLSGGVADGLGKILRARNAKGQYKNMAIMQKRILIFQGVTGLLATVWLIIGAEFIAETVFHLHYSTVMIRILAGALCIRVITTVIIGCFLGEGKERIATLISPIRQILLLVFGLIFTNPLADYGTRISALLGNDAYTAMYGGGGLAAALVVTEFFIGLYVCVLFAGNRGFRKAEEIEGMKQVDTLPETLRSFLGAVWMPILCHTFPVLLLWLGMFFYRKNEPDDILFAENFGMFCGKFLALCGIPVLIMCIMLLTRNIKTLHAFKKEDYRLTKNMYQNGLRMAVTVSLFFTMYIAVMSSQLAGICIKGGSKVLAEMFAFGSSLILFTVCFFYFSYLLNLLGKKVYLLGGYGLVMLVFVVLSILLLNKGNMGIMALLYAGIAATLMGCVLLGFGCCRMLHVKLDWLRTFAIPIGGVSCIGLLCILLGKVFTPHLGNFVTAFVNLFIGGILYLILYKKLNNY